MHKPIKIAIVGRPNVGKSSLFNRLCQKRIAICHEQEGVTRDRIYGDSDFFGVPLRFIDTGGIDPNKKDPFQEELHIQSMIAAEEADVVVLVVDGRSGLTLLDEMVARRILKQKKKILLAVNKIDHDNHKQEEYAWHTLGISNVIFVSAIQNLGIEELLECAIEDIPLQEEEDPSTKPEISIAILGRANVGKSTLLNQIFSEARSIVSDELGTTRDPIDVSMILEKAQLTFIDTAGIRKKKSQKNPVEKFADIRTQEVLKRADLCLFLIDVTRGLTTEEKRIASMIDASGKGCILLCNKWDLVKGFQQEHCIRALQTSAPFLKHIPILFISAKYQKDLSKVFTSIFQVYDNLSLRISTGELNRFIAKAVEKAPPPMIQGKRFKIYYMTQISTRPMRFMLFVNRVDRFTKTYRKYLMNQLRKAYPLSGAPIQFSCKSHQENKAVE